MADSLPWGADQAQALAESLARQCDGYAMPRHFFPLVHTLAGYLLAVGRNDSAISLLRSEAHMGVERHLDARLEHAQLLAQALMETGESQEALDLMLYYCERPFLFDDLSKLGTFVAIHAADSLRAGDRDRFANCLTLLAETAAGLRHGYFLRLAHHAGGVGALLDTAGSRLKYGTRIAVRLLGISAWLSRHGVLAGVLGRGMHFALTVLRALRRAHGESQSGLLPLKKTKEYVPQSEDSRPIVVARAMGGIGDIMMMTPGLRALARKHPEHEIWFAVPPWLMPVVQGIPFAKVVDINSMELTQESCHAFHNLTLCPASQVERASLPHVTQNRIDIFAAAMGVSCEDLDACGRLPFYRVSEDEACAASEYLAEHGCKAKQFVAIQPFSADVYKDYAYMEKIAFDLAKTTKVIAFHSNAFKGYEDDNIIKLYGKSIRECIAIVSMAKNIICNDSAFVHIGAALKIPVTAIYCPTDGIIFTKYYQNVKAIRINSYISCNTCWRNRDVICIRNCKNSSECMNITNNNIYEAINDKENNQKNK